MKAADYIISFLKEQASATIFSLSGGMIAHLEDSIFLNPEAMLVSVKHEQAGAFAAEGYTRVSGVSGVAMGTSGPGATNMVTGIASAYFDSVPVLYITGQVRTDELTPSDSEVRQTGFQETKIIPIVSPITKYASYIEDVILLRYKLEKAYFLMHSGRKGPAVLDIPMDIQKLDIDPTILISFYDSEEYLSYKKLNGMTKGISIDTIVQDIKDAKKPIILVGGGIRLSGSYEILARFLEKSHIPVVTSLMGIDAVDHTYDGYIGMIGSYGLRHANILLMEADLVIVLGSRLDIRQTGAKKEEFAKQAKIIHVDIDPSELGYTVKHTQTKINTDVKNFLNILNDSEIQYPDYSDWHNIINRLTSLLPIYPSTSLHDFIHPNYFFARLTEIMPKGTIYVNDVGQNQMWSSQSLKLKSGDRLLNSGGLGSMGFSLPAALGAAFAPGIKKVVSLNGDGGFQMNIQELETISSHHLPVVIVVINNKSLGMVREFQETYFEGRNIGTVIGYSCPDLSLIAKAYRMPYFQIKYPEDVDVIFSQIHNVVGPYILEVMISNKAIIEPKVLYGNTLDKQSPELSSELEQKIKNIIS